MVVSIGVCFYNNKTRTSLHSTFGLKPNDDKVGYISYIRLTLTYVVHPTLKYQVL